MKKHITILFILIQLSGFSQQLEWLHEFNYSGETFCHDLSTDQFGNVYLTGAYIGDAKGLFVSKYDPNGNMIWEDTANVTGGLRLKGVITDTAGNSYLFGKGMFSTINFGSYQVNNISFNDMFIVKYNSSGTVLWLRQFLGAEPEQMVMDNQGNLIVGGTCDSTLFDGFMIDKSFIAKFDTSGLCISAFSDPYQLSDLTIDRMGNIFINTRVGFSSYSLRKYDAAANFKWAAGSSSYSARIGSDKYGNCYLASNNSLRRLDSTGYCSMNIYAYNKISYMLDADSSGTVYVADYTKSSLWVGKFDTAGNYQLIDSIPATSDHWYIPFDIKSDRNGNVFVTGYTSGENAIGFIAKISENVTGVQTQESNSSFTVFPNPTNESVTVCYTGEGGTCNLKVSNLTGQVFYNKKLEPVNGTLNERIDLKAYSKGMYFIEVAGEKRRLVKKVIVN